MQLSRIGIVNDPSYLNSFEMKYRDLFKYDLLCDLV